MNDMIRSETDESLSDWLEELQRYGYNWLPGIPYSRYDIEAEIMRRESDDEED